MMIGRRQLLMGLAAGVALAPAWNVKSWAGAAPGAAIRPRFMSAVTGENGQDGLVLMDEAGAILDRFDTPERGHGGALRPDGAQAVLFSRRPGQYMAVVDLAGNAPVMLVGAAPGRHFYGHGCYSPDGRLLYATENDYDGERGVLGIYDVEDGFARVGEFDTYGVGPHEVVGPVDGGRHLVVANGGMLTHPDAPRMVLNVPSMQPSITLIDRVTGEKLESWTPPAELHQLSLRHIDVRGHTVAIGGQWQGSQLDLPPLVALARPGEELALFDAPADVQRGLQNYCGSVRFSGDGSRFAVSAPRGNMLTLWHADGSFDRSFAMADVCGIASMGPGFFATSGEGEIAGLGGAAGTRPLARHALSFDNHVTVIG